MERFHRSLKAALRTRLTGPNWFDELPWILLGIQTAPKDDLHASSAELVYGAPLAVPGDLVTTFSEEPDPAVFLPALRKKVCQLVPIPMVHHRVPVSYVPPSLQTCRFVFVRRDAHRSPLQRPYEGPFQVLEAGPKTFKVRMGNRTKVSIDRLKPAHLDLDQPIRVALPRPLRQQVPQGSGGSDVADHY